MVYNTHNHWVSALCLLSANSKYLENTTCQKLDLFPSSGEGRETPNQLRLLERANINHLVSGAYVAVLYGMDCPVIEVRSFLETQRSKGRPPHTWERKQIQFPKHCVF
jgi:hypothetical protein